MKRKTNNKDKKKIEEDTKPNKINTKSTKNAIKTKSNTSY
jgi:hypothetical protein